MSALVVAAVSALSQVLGGHHQQPRVGIDVVVNSVGNSDVMSASRSFADGGSIGHGVCLIDLVGRHDTIVVGVSSLQ